jgi:hypothetical protein
MYFCLDGYIQFQNFYVGGCTVLRIIFNVCLSPEIVQVEECRPVNYITRSFIICTLLQV